MSSSEGAFDRLLAGRRSAARPLQRAVYANWQLGYIEFLIRLGARVRAEGWVVRCRRRLGDFTRQRTAWTFSEEEEVDPRRTNHSPWAGPLTIDEVRSKGRAPTRLPPFREQRKRVLPLGGYSPAFRRGKPRAEEGRSRAENLQAS